MVQSCGEWKSNPLTFVKKRIFPCRGNVEIDPPLFLNKSTKKYAFEFFGPTKKNPLQN